MGWRLSGWLEAKYDAAEARVLSHRRKVAVVGFVVVFWPQWFPAAKSFFSDVLQPVLTMNPTNTDWSWLQWSGWNWLTVPLGFLLIWRAVRNNEVGGVRFDHEWERPYAEKLAKQSNDHGTGHEIRERVRATQIGFYDNVRRREGDVFTLSKASHFSEKWMERVSPDTPEKVTTSAQALRQVEAGLRGKNPEEADQMRINDLRQVVSGLTEARNVLVKERDATLVNLNDRVTELAATRAALAECMAEYALCKLERFGRKCARREDMHPKMTVRFIDYADRNVADRVESLFVTNVGWQNTECVQIDGSRIRPPDNAAFRVLFESGSPEVLQELAMIFNEGNLLQEPVGCKDLFGHDDFNVVVTIFPRTTT